MGPVVGHNTLGEHDGLIDGLVEGDRDGIKLEGLDDGWIE